MIVHAKMLQTNCMPANRLSFNRLIAIVKYIRQKSFTQKLICPYMRDGSMINIVCSVPGRMFTKKLQRCIIRPHFSVNCYTCAIGKESFATKCLGKNQL